MVLRVVLAVLFVLAAAVVPANAQRAGDWTENDLELWGVTPEDIASDAGFWYWKLAYAGQVNRARDGLPITDFPGQLLLPSRTMPLFQRLQFVGASAGPQWDSGKPGYAVVLQERDTGGSATFEGAFGREGYEGRARSGALPSMLGAEAPPNCESAGYCSYRPHGEDQPVGERFLGLKVNGYLAVVGHNHYQGEHWYVTWHDSALDVSYSINLEWGAAERVGAAGRYGPENLRYAQQLVAIAANLAPVKIPRVPHTPLQVVEAMRSCLPIQELRVDPNIPALERRLVYVEGSAEPLFLVEFADVGGPASVTAEHYRHHLDPRVALIFVRDPGSMEPPASRAEMRALHERVRVCFLASPT